MAKMTYLEGREAIKKMLDKYPNNKHRQGVIDQVLWSVAYGEGVTFANALIILFELDWFANGSHNFFYCEDTGSDYHRNRYPHSVSSPDDYRELTNRQSKSLELMVSQSIGLNGHEKDF